MITSQVEYYNAKYKDLIILQCDLCNQHYKKEKSKVRNYFLNKTGKIFCSKPCQTKWQNGSLNIECGQCKKSIVKHPNAIRKSKSGLTFCNRSCSAIYKNTHKTTGTRRSRLEKWLELKLINLLV